MNRPTSMLGRFSARRVAAPDFVPAPDEPGSTTLEGISWTVSPEPEAAPEPAQAPSANPLLSDKLLDAKVRCTAA